MKMITSCKLCELCVGSQPVNGIGNPDANIMFILSTPNYYTVKNNNFYESASGKLMAKLLTMINLNKDDVYITHLIKGRTTTPKVKNVLACKPYLKDEIDSVNPKIIIPMGTLAVQTITQSKLPIMSYSNKAIISTDGTYILPMFNLDYITRDVRFHGLILKSFIDLYKLYSTFINPNIRQFEENLHAAVKRLLNPF